MKERILAVFAALVMSLPAHAQLERISNQDAGAGLREALVKGTQSAVATLGRSDGFLGNPKVKITLPESLARVDRLLRGVGMGRYSDELVLTMNRAAEAAVPEAKPLFIDAVKKMSLQDAKGILTGGEDSATQYFRRSTAEQLRARFLPIVQKATAKLPLAEKYNQYAEKGVAFGLVRKEDANLDGYVTQRTLDGLFLMVAEEEKRIRQNPAQAASELLKKVFGALR